MPFNRQFMGITGDFTTAVKFPPQATVRQTDTPASDNPESPITLVSASPNPNEIWRVKVGEILEVFLHIAGGTQASAGQIYICKRLMGNLGTRWYMVQPLNQIASKGDSQDVNFALRMQQSLRIHPGESLVLAINDGGTAIDVSRAENQVSIWYEVASAVTPAQMRASIARWG